MVERVDAMTLGDGLGDPCPDFGPVIDTDRAAAIDRLVTDALDDGAIRLSRERTFPAAAVFRFRAEAEALRRDLPALRDRRRCRVLAAKGRPHVSAGALVAYLVGLSLGVVCGHFAAGRVFPERASHGVVALGAAAATLFRGLLNW